MKAAILITILLVVSLFYLNCVLWAVPINWITAVVIGLLSSAIALWVESGAIYSEDETSEEKADVNN